MRDTLEQHHPLSLPHRLSYWREERLPVSFFSLSFLLKKHSWKEDTPGLLSLCFSREPSFTRVYVMLPSFLDWKGQSTLRQLWLKVPLVDFTSVELETHIGTLIVCTCILLTLSRVASILNDEYRRWQCPSVQSWREIERYERDSDTLNPLSLTKRNYLRIRLQHNRET